jgi:dCTP deaminase
LVSKPGQTVDLSGSETVAYENVDLAETGYILKPNEFILGSTYEKFQVPRDIVCHIDGRSTLARLGLSIHCTSQVVDGNFDEPRTVVLEMKNIGNTNLILKPKLAVAMITFSQLSSPIVQDSQKQYQGQEGVMPPNLKIQKE